MVDKKLLFAAMMDDQFQNIIRDDQILNQLENKRYNKAQQLTHYNALFNRKARIDKLEVNQLTLSRWSLLWILQNAFAAGKEQITNIDVDLFVYVLDCQLHQLNEYALINSVDYCKKIGIDYKIATADILYLIKSSFSSLKMLSDTQTTDGGDIFFGADWVLHMVSIISQECNESTDYIIHHMPLCLCYLYLIQAVRKTTTKQIFRLTDDDINKQIFQRTYQLANIYYQKNYGGK